MHRIKRSLPFCACVVVACSSAAEPSTEPPDVVGTYTASSFTPVPTSTGSTVPIFPGTTVGLDSLGDTIILNRDNTYTERGSAWAAGNSTPAFAFVVHGAYTQRGNVIELTPPPDAPVRGATALFAEGKLTFERSSWTWEFSRDSR